jgi:hypothetical protein
MAQSSEQAPFTSEIVGSILTYVKRVSQRSTKSRMGFLPPTGNVGRVGWD